MSRYRTIVADPPWDHSDGTGARFGRGMLPNGAKRHPDRGTSTTISYPTMTVDEIAALPVDALAETDAHLYLWTTQRYLRDSFGIVEAWGFAVSATLVWCKPERGWLPGGAYASNVEFVHFARRGRLPAKARCMTRWWEWPRRVGPPVRYGDHRRTMHSAKPEAFLDVVEQVSPGPHLELFARRNRLGWDSWGNEALCHVDLAGQS